MDKHFFLNICSVRLRFNKKQTNTLILNRDTRVGNLTYSKIASSDKLFQKPRHLTCLSFLSDKVHNNKGACLDTLSEYLFFAKINQPGMKRPILINQNANPKPILAIGPLPLIGEVKLSFLVTPLLIATTSNAGELKAKLQPSSHLK